MDLSLDSSSTESDVFYVQQSSLEGSPVRNNTPCDSQLDGDIRSYGKRSHHIFLWRLSGTLIVTLDSDSNDPTVPYGFGSQQPIVPPSLDELNPPPNPFNMLATMAVIRADDAYSPQSPEPSIPSPNSTPPMNVSTIEGWGDTTHITTDNATFYTDDEPRRVYWDISSSNTFDSNEPRNVSVASSPSSTPPPPRRQKRELIIGMSFPKKRGVSQHTCEACSQPLLPGKTP